MKFACVSQSNQKCSTLEKIAVALRESEVRFDDLICLLHFQFSICGFVMYFCHWKKLISSCAEKEMKVEHDVYIFFKY